MFSNISSTGPRKRQSIHGDVWPSGRGSGDWKTSRLTICCIQVVPTLGAVAIITSPSRGLYEAHRRLSQVKSRTTLVGSRLSMLAFLAVRPQCSTYDRGAAPPQ